MPGGEGFFGGVGILFFVRLGVKCGGVVVVAIAGIDVVFLEFGIGGEGVGDFLCHHAAQVMVDTC